MHEMPITEKQEALVYFCKINSGTEREELGADMAALW